MIKFNRGGFFMKKKIITVLLAMSMLPIGSLPAMAQTENVKDKNILESENTNAIDSLVASDILKANLNGSLFEKEETKNSTTEPYELSSAEESTSETTDSTDSIDSSNNTESTQESTEESSIENSTDSTTETTEDTTTESTENVIEERTEVSEETQESVEIKSIQEPKISYSSKINGVGWQNVINTGISGTVGQNKTLSAFRVSLDSPDIDGEIQYQSHFANVGWQGFVGNNTVSGNDSSTIPIQAIQLKLTENLAAQYNIYYRVHCSDIGWLDWAKNGETAGTTGFDLGIQAIEIRLIKKDIPFTESTNRPSIINTNPSVIYQTHVENKGWLPATENGNITGTVGQNLQLEAFSISLKNQALPGNVNYQAHVENIGWQSIQSNGSVAGTSGRNLTIEALKINLSGEISLFYDIYYRVHVANFGWLSWAKNGESTGTSGFNNQMEAIQVVVSKKGSAGFNTSGKKYITFPNASYTSHVSNIGWQGSVSNKAISGTTGRNLKVEAIKISLNNMQLAGNIHYSSYVKSKGWQGFVNNGAVSGTTGQGLPIEALQIKLSGEISNYVDVYYRVHSSNFGWLGWAKNGASAGTLNYGYQVEAYQVALVRKGGAAPGSGNNAYISKPVISSKNMWKIATGGVQPNLSGRKNLRIEVSIANQRVYIYDGSSLIYTMWCSTGLPGSPTPLGNFRIEAERGLSFGGAFGGARYWRSFKGHGVYLFHSVPIDGRGNYIISEAEKLGQRASHGCIRLSVPDAIWFYNQTPYNTPVRVY